MEKYTNTLQIFSFWGGWTGAKLIIVFFVDDRREKGCFTKE